MAVLPTLADAPLEISTSATPEEIKRRARIAEALLLEGSQGAPIQHWTQGLNRVAQGLVGGYQLGQLRREAEKEQADEAASVLRLPGMRRPPAIEYGPTTPQQAIPPSPATVPAPIRYNNPGGQYPGPSASAQGSTGYATIGGGHKIAAFDTPEAGAAAQFDLLNRGYTGRTVADAVAKWSGGNNVPAYVASVERAGIPRDTVITPEFLRSPQGIQLAQAMAQHETGRPYPMTLEQWQSAQGRAFGNQPTTMPRVSGQEGGGPPRGLGPQRQPVDLAPDVAASIEDLVRRGKGKEARAMYDKFAKPREEFRQLTTPQERAAFGIPPEDNRLYQVSAAGEVKHPPAETKVNVSTVADPILKGVGEQFTASRDNAISAARQTIPNIHEARRALDEGATTGAFAEPRVFAQKVAAFFGIAPDQAANTEQFRAAVSGSVLADIKKLGTNPTNVDLKFINDVKGGNIALEEKTLRRLLDIQEKYARQSIQNYNKDAEKLIKANPSAYRGVAGLMSLDEPPAYEAPPPPPQRIPTWNPATGRIE